MLKYHIHLTTQKTFENLFIFKSKAIESSRTKLLRIFKATKMHFMFDIFKCGSMPEIDWNFLIDEPKKMSLSWLIRRNEIYSNFTRRSLYTTYCNMRSWTIMNTVEPYLLWGRGKSTTLLKRKEQSQQFFVLKN